ncbi:MAG: SDR family NAD(P)-dependent oxidoreductase [Planctomycetota bacterium]|nr:SDR family NAD(P)-dependent oxidoreductase [Planctomycetota bacterium]
MRDSTPLVERTAIVTGGASGIGRATAFLLASQGARVFAADIDFVAGTEADFAAESIAQIVCDVTSETDVAGLMEWAETETGRLDIVVNSAGVGLVKQITDVTVEEWDRCLDTNVKGAFLTAKHAIPKMRAMGGGSIINIASNAGLLPRAHDPVYSISKGALIALTKSLALCHAPDRIRINAVCPGPVGATRMMDDSLDAAPDRATAVRELLAASPFANACGRMITPAEVAQAVLYLVSDAALFVTGTSIAIDGGKSLGVPPKMG